LKRQTGRYIFEESSHDPYILGRYETIESTDSSFLDSLLGKGLPPKKAFNLKGGCYPSTITQDEKKYIQRIFRPLPYWREQTNKIIDKLKYSDNKNRTLIALHIRRGDSKNSGCYVPSSNVYLNWLDSIWHTLENPILYIASDEIYIVKKDFISFHPYSFSDFNSNDEKISFIIDFFIFTQSDIMVKVGSSFSDLAALCNEKCQVFYYTNLKSHTIEPCDGSLLMN